MKFVAPSERFNSWSKALLTVSVVLLAGVPSASASIGALASDESSPRVRFHSEAQASGKWDRFALSGMDSETLQREYKKLQIAFRKQEQAMPPRASELEVTELLPQALRRVLEVNPVEELEGPGPNCFSVALAAKGAREWIDHVSGAEFQAWLQSDEGQCVQVKAAADLRPGDLGVIRTPSTEDVPSGLGHAFFWISNQLVLSKASADPDDSASFKPLTEELSRFQVPENCRAPFEAGDSSEKCPTRLEAWRCSGWSDAKSKAFLDSAPAPGWRVLWSDLEDYSRLRELAAYDRTGELKWPESKLSTWERNFTELSQRSSWPTLQRRVEERLKSISRK